MTAALFATITPAETKKLEGHIQKFVHNRSTAESIAQDAIGKAWQYIGTLKNPKKLIPWIYTIAINLARHWIRDRKRREEDLYLEDGSRNHPQRYRDGFAETITQEALALFDRHMKRLTKMQRRALLLRIIDRLDYFQIGQRMKLTEGSVRALVHRARMRLKRWYRYMRAL